MRFLYRHSRRLPERKEAAVWFWNMAGSMCNAANTVLMTMVIARVCGVVTCGIYSLALAVVEMIGPIGSFDVRYFQVSDVKKKYKLNDYHALRLLTIFMAGGIVAGWILINQYSFEKALVVALCMLYKLVDCYDDVFQGELQINDRLDLAGKSFALRILTDTILFFVVLILTKNLILSYVIYIIYAILWVFVFTVAYSNNFNCVTCLVFDKVGLIMKETVSLCLMQFIITYIVVAPKYAIDKFYEPQMQTYFSILFMPASVINLFTFIVYRIYIKPLSEKWAEGKIKDFIKQMFCITGYICVIGLVAVIGAWLLGIPILKWFYGVPEIASYKKELTIVMVGGIFNAMSGWFKTVLTILRYQNSALIAGIASAITALAIIDSIVRDHGLMGAVIGYNILLLVYLGIEIILLIYIFCKKAERK